VNGRAPRASRWVLPRPGPSAVARPSPAAVARRGLIGAALARAEHWLIEPAPPALEPVAPSHSLPRPVIAVFGLTRGCGTTVVGALAAELGSRDPAGAAAVICEARAAGIPLATHAAARLARALEDLPGASTRAVGRLCLIEGADHLAVADSSRQLAPLVLDAGSGGLGGVPAALADRTVLVTTPAVEPALAPVAASCLARLGPEPAVVLNRARSRDRDPDLWSQPAVERFRHRSGMVFLPESRMGAQLALGGREARGDLGRAVAELADRCEGVA
jgi:hypothetical protein